MGFSRYEAKMRAKASMRGAYPHPMLVTLVYILMTVVLMYVVIFLCFGSLFAQMAAYIAMGYDSMDVMMRLHPMAIPRTLCAWPEMSSPVTGTCWTALP